MKLSNKGFTLVELLIALLIFGMVLTILAQLSSKQTETLVYDTTSSISAVQAIRTKQTLETLINGVEISWFKQTWPTNIIKTQAYVTPITPWNFSEFPSRTLDISQNTLDINSFPVELLEKLSQNFQWDSISNNFSPTTIKYPITKNGTTVNYLIPKGYYADTESYPIPGNFNVGGGYIIWITQGPMTQDLPASSSGVTVAGYTIREKYNWFITGALIIRRSAEHSITVSLYTRRKDSFSYIDFTHVIDSMSYTVQLANNTPLVLATEYTVNYPNASVDEKAYTQLVLESAVMPIKNYTYTEDTIQDSMFLITLPYVFDNKAQLVGVSRLFTGAPIITPQSLGIINEPQVYLASNKY